MTEHAETIAFRPRQRRTQARVKRRRRQLAERRPARVVRRLALAHRIAADIEAGRYKDYTDVARRHGLTLRRVLASLCWEDQRAAWAELRPEADLPG